jgi:hypothetical protein
MVLAGFLHEIKEGVNADGAWKTKTVVFWHRATFRDGFAGGDHPKK